MLSSIPDVIAKATNNLPMPLLSFPKQTFQTWSDVVQPKVVWVFYCLSLHECKGHAPYVISDNLWETHVHLLAQAVTNFCMSCVSPPITTLENTCQCLIWAGAAWTLCHSHGKSLHRHYWQPAMHYLTGMYLLCLLEFSLDCLNWPQIYFVENLCCPCIFITTVLYNNGIRMCLVYPLLLIQSHPLFPYA